MKWQVLDHTALHSVGFWRYVAFFEECNLLHPNNLHALVMHKDTISLCENFSEKEKEKNCF
jgi:hypothetical protein